MKVVEVKKAEQQQFKFGDKVRILSEGEYGDLAVGNVGVVLSTDMCGQYTIKVHTERDYDYFNPNQLQLETGDIVDLHKKIEGRKYKVITGNGSFDAGEIITLTDDDGTSMPWFTGEEDSSWMDMSRVELLPEEAEEPAVTIELSLQELQCIVTGIDATNVSERERSARLNGYSEVVAQLGHELLVDLKKAVKEAV